MDSILTQIAHHGYWIIFAAVLAESLGMPMPAALVMVAGGAAGASGILSAPWVLAICMIAMIAGDEENRPSSTGMIRRSHRRINVMNDLEMSASNTVPDFSST
jgi:hypothetical protein